MGTTFVPKKHPNYMFVCCRHCGHSEDKPEGHFGPCPEDKCKDGKVKVTERLEAAKDVLRGKIS